VQDKERTKQLAPPILIKSTHVAPKFPSAARDAHVDGRVILSGTVGTDGILRDLVVIQCTPSGMGFEEAALDAVSRWRYEPATLEGEPIEVTHSITVTFSQ
jgi:protein TonB